MSLFSLFSCQHQKTKAWTEHFPKKESKVLQPPAKPKVWVFMLAGQSNMAGLGKVEAQDTLPHSRLFSLNEEGELVLAQEPLHRYELPLTGLGCGLAFGKELLPQISDSLSILLVPTAITASSISMWLNNEEHRGYRLLSNFKEKVNQAKAYGEIKGILWHQGESDAQENLYPHYEERLNRLSEIFREICANPELPLFIGELGSFSKNKLWAEVNKQIASYCRQDPRAYIIKTDDLKHNGDGIHFNNQSQRILGQRFAAAFVEHDQP